MTNHIVEVAHLGDQRLFLCFADDRAGEVDLAPLLQFTGVFEPLRDPEFFAQVRVNPDIGTMVWPNGADLCPDVLIRRGARPEGKEQPVHPPRA